MLGRFIQNEQRLPGLVTEGFGISIDRIGQSDKMVMVRICTVAIVIIPQTNMAAVLFRSDVASL